MSHIKGYHAHVYYDAGSRDTALALCEKSRDLFDVTMGRMHDAPVGPHPMGSCQLGFAPDLFNQVIPWLALNRQGLTIFTHPETGKHLEDHRDHAIWMGQLLPLNLAIFD
ncbi:MAG: DOPA 4,5-dioxygenase family protein [Sedimentitalea sp.]